MNRPTNQSSELLVFRAADLETVARVPVDSYPVGLAVSPDGSELWTTSQGREERGGTSVGIFHVRYRDDEAVAGLAGAGDRH